VFIQWVYDWSAREKHTHTYTHAHTHTRTHLLLLLGGFGLDKRLLLAHLLRIILARLLLLLRHVVGDCLLLFQVQLSTTLPTPIHGRCLSAHVTGVATCPLYFHSVVKHRVPVDEDDLLGLLAYVECEWSVWCMTKNGVKDVSTAVENEPTHPQHIHAHAQLHHTAREHVLTAARVVLSQVHSHEVQADHAFADETWGTVGRAGRARDAAELHVVVLKRGEAMLWWQKRRQVCRSELLTWHRTQEKEVMCTDRTTSWRWWSVSASEHV
jgi:hypothetical protein